jgi:hypothetical protein
MPSALGIQGARAPVVVHDRGQQQRTFHGDGARDRIPQAETDKRPPDRAADRNVRDAVEHPVTDDGEADDKPGACAAEDRRRNPACRDAPDHRHAETVAPGIVHERERL